METSDLSSIRVAYFSMEVGLSVDLPTYSGGLGVLAGDTLRAAADLGVPLVGVTLIHRRGYFRQSISKDGAQTEADVRWQPEAVLTPVAARSEVTIEGRKVALRAFRRDVVGVDGHVIPLLFLDADVDGNAAEDRRLTDHLYGGDHRYRIAQEIILGIGGRRMLAALGAAPDIYHMNEGHSALLSLDLLAAELGDGELGAAVERVRQRCVFTTHTPVPAGHDSFPRELAEEVLGAEAMALHAKVCPEDSELNMSHLGLALSGFVNGVARRHGEVSRAMFPGHQIHAITNGVHTRTWTSAPFQALFDQHIPQWRHQSYALRLADKIPLCEILAAHAAAKRALIDAVQARVGVHLDPDAFTIGYGRRSTAYKRPTLLFHDPVRLQELVARRGPLQVIYAGKAHPRDSEGKELITAIHGLREQLGPGVRLVYLPGYDMTLGLLMTSGVDLWLNTPRAPLEASGTSGMKAAHNGVPNLSVRDGWWVEGCIEGQTGWAIEPAGEHGPVADAAEAAQIYKLLDEVILPLYCAKGTGWAEVMRRSISLAASYFNAQRMLEEYRTRAYRLG